MNNIFKNLPKSNWFYAGLLLVAGAVVYLLFLWRLSFYYDDWYIIYDAHTQGAQFLHVVYSGDRPARGYLLALAYNLFGDQLIFYHITAFLFRYVSTMAFSLTLNAIWAKNERANFLISLLLIIYPGYFFQSQAVDFLPQVISFSLALISIALTMKAQRTRSLVGRLVLVIISSLMGWFYLGLIEYFLGLEFLRLLFIYLETMQGAGTIKRKVFKTCLGWLPYAIVPIGFLLWRSFLFDNTRAATDVGQQLGVLLKSPLITIPHWGLAMFYSAVNAIFAAWIVPFYDFIVMGDFRIKEIIWILALGTGLTAFLLLSLYWLKKEVEEKPGEPVRREWIRQAIWGGIAIVIMGLIPVIISNRRATLDFGDHYLLASAPGAVMIVVAGLHLLSDKRAQAGVLGTLIFFSTAAHIGNIFNHIDQTESTRDFWWQVSWRAPQIKTGTTLIASYSLTYAPDEFITWAPANLIYYPQKLEGNPIPIQLPALIHDEYYISRIITQDKNGYTRDMRGNWVDADFNKILVLIQPQGGNCVRIIDGSAPELSAHDPAEMMIIAPFSKIDTILVDAEPAIPPKGIFGPEPEHTWCYYYQKAALARSREDWLSVVTLMEGALDKGFSPKDPIEWMPLLQAYVAKGQIYKLEHYVSIMTEPLIRNETCKILMSTVDKTRPGESDLKNTIENYFCP